MKKMTSAYANKFIRQLEEDKAFWLTKERESYLYTAALNEEPVIPEYDYEEISEVIAGIDEKICKIKHAINLSNINSLILAGEKEMSIDCALVRMAQLNKRKIMLDSMRKILPKTRVMGYAMRNQVPEYQYINYDLEVVKADYEKINDEIMAIQIALDKHNQTVEFEVDID